MRTWKRLSAETIYRHRLFELRREELESGSGDAKREAVVLDAPRWVNVVALDADDTVLLVRQWRFGIASPTLEIPGGMVEAESPRAAAERELLEETGYRADAWRQLGEVDPNPAFLTNRCSTFLATGLERIGEPSGDGEEEIRLESASLAELPRLVARGEIRHALVVAAFYLLELDRRAP